MPPEQSPSPALTTKIEQQLASAGMQVAVESSDGTLVLSGIVDTEEARQAASDIVSQIAPNARIDNQLEVEAVLPTDVDDFVSDDPTAELADTPAEIVDSGGELDPDFTDRPGMNDPIAASGAGDSGDEDPASTGEVYTPPIDPVITTNLHGDARVLGGFETDSAEDVGVEPSAEDNRPGDEALADAIRRELNEDSSTTDLNIVVAVRNGVAHLRGQVADLEDAENAEAVAARVPGVRDVVEEIEVAGL
jgi:osmotically-inducible protein OsmY